MDWTTAVIVVVSALAGAVGLWASGYVTTATSKIAEIDTLSSKLSELVMHAEALTKAQERVKHDLEHISWERKQRWERKFELYLSLIDTTGEVLRRAESREYDLLRIPTAQSRAGNTTEEFIRAIPKIRLLLIADQAKPIIAAIERLIDVSRDSRDPMENCERDIGESRKLLGHLTELAHEDLRWSAPDDPR